MVRNVFSLNNALLVYPDYAIFADEKRAVCAEHSSWNVMYFPVAFIEMLRLMTILWLNFREDVTRQMKSDTVA